jgi:hypothetical protein
VLAALSQGERVASDAASEVERGMRVEREPRLGFDPLRERLDLFVTLLEKGLARCRVEAVQARGREVGPAK